MALSLSLSRVKRQRWVPIALIGLGMVWLGALAFQANVIRGARLWFIGAERHLGTYQRGDVVTHRIWLINPTLREVKVAVQPSCGCSVAELPYDSIPPLNGFPIEVRIETHGQPLGWQEKGFVIEARQGDQSWQEVVKFGLDITQSEVK